MRLIKNLLLTAEVLSEALASAKTVADRTSRTAGSSGSISGGYAPSQKEEKRTLKFSFYR